MEMVGDAAKAEARVFADMQSLLSKLRELAAGEIASVDKGGARLREIRIAVYEDLNQIQHEYLILRGLRWLVANGFGVEAEWEWNPRQRGNATEPDLRGSLNRKVLVSAEATASEKPEGSLDTRMRETLKKLAKMEGEKFYFVAADKMVRRAETKIRENGWDIRVVRV